METPGFVSVVPTLIVFALAVWTRRPIESLIIGAIVGLLILHGDQFIGGFADASLRVMTDEGVAWVILRGAAVARRRIKLTLDGPLNALWETIGRCGSPPSDPARTFGLIAVILALLPWLLIPTGLLVSWLTEIF